MQKIRSSLAIASCMVMWVTGCASSGTTAARPGSAGELLGSSVHKTAQTVPLTGPLGSATNPVRVLMPEGERTYLYRLRCREGNQPTFVRNGSGEFGPYGRILDFYTVKCNAVESGTTVVMDMYHCVEETRPVPGFEIVPEIEQRAKTECR